MTVSQAGGRIAITITFHKERTLKPREGGGKRLSQCFVYSTTLNCTGYAFFFPKKSSQNRILAHAEQAGFEALP